MMRLEAIAGVQYIICTDEAVTEHELKMITENNIRGMISPKVLNINGSKEYWFDITGCLSFKDQLEGRGFSLKEAIEVFTALKEAVAVLEGYLINSDRVLFDPQYIFKRAEKYFLLYDIEGQGCIKDKIILMLKECMNYTSYSSREEIRCVYEVFDKMLTEDSSINELIEYFKEEYDKQKKTENISECVGNENDFNVIKSDISERRIEEQIKVDALEEINIEKIALRAFIIAMLLILVIVLAAFVYLKFISR